MSKRDRSAKRGVVRLRAKTAEHYLEIDEASLIQVGWLALYRHYGKRRDKTGMKHLPSPLSADSCPSLFDRLIG
jgi:hypothetical protein